MKGKTKTLVLMMMNNTTNNVKVKKSPSNQEAWKFQYPMIRSHLTLDTR